MIQTQQLLHVTLTQMALFPDDVRFGQDVIAAISSVTGIAPSLLARVQGRVRRSGSLNPLRALLADADVARAGAFSYLLTVGTQSSQPRRPGHQVHQTIRLQIQTPRGRVQLKLAACFSRLRGPSGERQVAQIAVTCLVESGAAYRSFAHKVVLVNDPLQSERPWAQAA